MAAASGCERAGRGTSAPTLVCDIPRQISTRREPSCWFFGPCWGQEELAGCRAEKCVDAIQNIRVIELPETMSIAFDGGRSACKLAKVFSRHTLDIRPVADRGALRMPRIPPPSDFEARSRADRSFHFEFVSARRSSHSRVRDP